MVKLTKKQIKYKKDAIEKARRMYYKEKHHVILDEKKELSIKYGKFTVVFE